MIDLNRFMKMVGGAEAAPAEAGGRRKLSRYEILREVGRGGMGVVYEAFDPELKRRVAIKVLKDTEANSTALARLQREALAAAKLRHPNIVPVYEVGSVLESSGAAVHFIVMAFIEGQTFEEVLPRLKRRERLQVMETAARAVGHAHRQGIIHRDLKPQNVMVEPPREGDSSDLGRRVYILDFGLAKMNEGEDLTRSGAIMGTPYYMAPEQVNGEHRRVAPATDVWGLGVMLYQVLTGRMPFEGRTAMEIYTAIAGQDPAPLRGLDRTIHPDLEALCHRALSKPPARRYPSAHEFADELRRHLGGEPVRAKPPSATGRILRKLVKRKAVVGTAAVGLLALVLLAILIVPRWVRAEEQRRIAEAESRRKEGEVGALSRMREEEARRQAEELKRRRERILAALGDLRAGLSRPGRPAGAPLLDDYVFECSQYNDEQTVTLLADAIAPLAQKATRETRWIQEERDLMTFAFRVLGRVDRDSAVAPLALMMGCLWNHSLAVACGTALCNTRRASAEAPLLAARDRLGMNSPTWFQIGPLLARVPSRDDSEPATAAALFTRGLARQARGDSDGAIADFSRVIALDPGNSDAFSNRANARRAKRDLEGALADYSRAIEINPGNFNAFTNRGATRCERRDFDGAIADLDRAITLQPRYATAFINRGTARHYKADRLAEAGRSTESDAERDGAFADCTRAIELDGRSSNAFNTRANIRSTRATLFAQQGNAQEAFSEWRAAVADFDRGLTIDPGNGALFTSRGLLRHTRASFLVAQGRHPEAAAEWEASVADYSRAVELDPKDAITFRNRGVARHARGDFEGAIADHTTAVELNPDYGGAYCSRGIARGASGDLEGALADFDRAIACDPRMYEAFCNRGLAWTRRENWTAAIADYTRAIEISPRRPDPYRFRGLSRQRLGDSAGAAADLQRALSLAPPDWPQRAELERAIQALEGKRSE